MSERVPLTPGGKAKLQEEISKLKTGDRPKIVKEIEAARAHGDLSENAEYHAAKDKQGQIEGRIRFLEDLFSRAEVIDPSKADGKRIVFGVCVRLYDSASDQEFVYRIVGEWEADAPRGHVSVTSPVARALIGKEEGDVVVVRTPGGERELEIVEIIVE